MVVELTPEHHWLHQLVGEWTTETVCPTGSDQSVETYRGTETGRDVGPWVVLDGQCPLPGGGISRSVMTLGYDPSKKKFVGTFIATMMTFLWVYEGELDAGRKTLELAANGPSFTDPAKACDYVDTIEIRDDGTRTLSSRYRAEDGTWVPFMTMTCRRSN